MAGFTPVEPIDFNPLIMVASKRGCDQEIQRLKGEQFIARIRKLMRDMPPTMSGEQRRRLVATVRSAVQ